MNMSKRTKFLLILGMVLLGLIFGVSVFMPRFQQDLVISEQLAVESEASYAEYSREEMIGEADAIFIGKVSSIFPGRWNQDSGQYWQQEGNAAIYFHQIDVTIEKLLVDTIGLSEQVTLTILGNSPINSSETDEVAIAGEVAHNLKVGDEAIFFVVARELGWKDGTRPIIRFLGDPREGYLLLGSDGLYHSSGQNLESISLDDLRKQIAENRR